jgi:thiamine kinase-like enzyme
MEELRATLADLEATLGAGEGEPQPLDGGITNRNYRVRFGGSDYMVRLPGKDTALLGIDRGAERIANEAAARLGIAPDVVAAGDRYIVTRFVAGGGSIDPDALRANPAPVGRALRAFHDSGIELPARFWVPELLDDYARIVAERGGSLPPEYADTQALARRIAEALPLLGAGRPRPCHDDLLPGNLMTTDGGESVLLVDWEYAGMGHPLFDLGNVAVNNEFDDGAEDRLLAAYHGAAPTDPQRAALKLMRLMSDAREAAWGVVQGVISELDFDFAQYAKDHFDRLSTAAADPRLEEWLDAATA